MTYIILYISISFRSKSLLSVKYFGYCILISVFIFYRLGRRHDLSRGKIPSTGGIKTMLDYLVFENNEVFNYFVDIRQIEKVIVTDDETAQFLFRR